MLGLQAHTLMYPEECSSRSSRVAGWSCMPVRCHAAIPWGFVVSSMRR